MKKIPARHTWLVMPAILALLMTFIVSGISTLKAIGMPPGFVGEWMVAWLFSYIVAFPVLLVILPLVRKLVAAVTE